MSQSPPNHPQAVVPPGDDDPLAHLHKMSTTAGLGSGDYVAVNGAAVFALILGLASALTLMNEILLIIPLAGIVVAILAFRQIRQSNGTQTGIGLVILGLILMLGFGGFVIAQNVTQEMRTRDDRRAISELVAQVGKEVVDGKFEVLYPRFSAKFRDRVSLAQFTDRLKSLRESGVYGKLKGMQAGLMQFQTDESTGIAYGVARIYLDFEKTQSPLPDDMTFKKEDSQWRVEGYTTLFPPPGNPGR